jgi:hypothetical protein
MVRVLLSVVCIERGAPASVRLPEKEAFDVVVKVVKLPVDGVVAPIAVPLIPVAVVLKLAEVNVKAFEPVSIDDAPRPDKVSAPEVPVMLTAPVVVVKPLEAVSKPFDVIVPPAVVWIFPVVDRVPSSLIVNFETPPDWISRDVLVAPFVSLMIKAVAVPALVRDKEVDVPRPDPNVKSILRPVVVVIVLPPLYAP